MRLRGLGRAKRAARWLRNRYAPLATILLYHRIIDLPADPSCICVAPLHFAEHLGVLRKYGRPMRLQELAHALHDGNIPSHAVAITFDDGYADNLENAEPLLEQFDVPATVFVATGQLGSEREFWWDELERVLMRTRLLPGTLELEVGGLMYHWQLGADSEVSSDRYERYGKRRYFVGPDFPSVRHWIYGTLRERLRLLDQPARDKILAELRTWAGVDGESRSTHRSLSREQLCQLSDSRLLEIGAHTVSHPVLSALPVDRQRAEITASKSQLQEILHRSVSSFSYPYGGSPDFTRQTTAAVKEAGFTLGCSTVVDCVWQGSDRWQLPRVPIPDCDGDQFAQWFLRFAGGDSSLNLLEAYG